ncbi:hypothetical protein M3196_12035 [Fictibacillus nanhaiensis]|jgi:hypothetical protein|uniref:hypothetical protein n=1 Tax=Fictibacillus nanhaiensis TaxID=742169 RepID=UPI00203D7A10|nr:hypothetical protein [Fictibacillus nanhaiensis]MCM3732391.1 hypothetical protein [Fictibacillus nanhaiensis]
MALVHFGLYRDLFIRYLREQYVIAEVFLMNSNQPPGTPDLTGVRVVEVGGDFVVFSQAGSAGAGLYVVPLDKILLVEL